MVDQLQHLLEGFVAIASVQHVLVIAAGICVGIGVGAIPGLSPSMGVALALPFTYTMSPMLAIVLLAAIYLAADYGGSISAVTINTPGTPAARWPVMLRLVGLPLWSTNMSRVARPGATSR